MTVDEMIAATRDWQRHGGFPPLFDADETLALVAEIERLRRAEADMRERAARACEAERLECYGSEDFSDDVAYNSATVHRAAAIRALPLSSAKEE